MLFIVKIEPHSNKLCRLEFAVYLHSHGYPQDQFWDILVYSSQKWSWLERAQQVARNSGDTTLDTVSDARSVVQTPRRFRHFADQYGRFWRDVKRNETRQRTSVGHSALQGKFSLWKLGWRLGAYKLWEQHQTSPSPIATNNSLTVTSMTLLKGIFLNVISTIVTVFVWTLLANFLVFLVNSVCWDFSGSDELI